MRCWLFSHPSLFFAFVCLACGVVEISAQPSQFGGPQPVRRRPPQEKSDEKKEIGFLPGVARDPSLGKIVWVDSSGKYAVVWLNTPQTLSDERFFGSRDEFFQPTALLKFSGEHGARAAGFIVEKGTVRLDEEIILPGIEALARYQKIDTPPEEPPTAPAAAKAL